MPPEQILRQKMHQIRFSLGLHHRSRPGELTSLSQTPYLYLRGHRPTSKGKEKKRKERGRRGEGRERKGKGKTSLSTPCSLSLIPGYATGQWG